MEEIFRRMLERISDRFDKTKGTFFYDVLKPVAYEIVDLINRQDIIISKLNIDNLVGRELDMYIGDRTSLERNMGQPSSGYVVVKGRAGTRIPKDSIFAADDLYFYTTHENIIGEEEVVDVEVVCEVVGRVGNVPANTINEIPMSITGVEEVNNPHSFNNGYDTESDEEFLKRYKILKQKPITSNNIYHFELWALSVDGVGGVKVVPTWKGPNTVKLIIVDNNGQPANEDLVKKVQDYIDPLEYWGQGRGVASAGAFVTVEPADIITVDVSADIRLNDTGSIETVVENFTVEINEHLADISFTEMGDEIRLAKIGCILMGIDGVEDYKNLKINGQSENIFIDSDEVVQVGGVDFEEIL